MSLQCTNCLFEIKSGRTSLGGPVSCERCGSRVDSGYNSRIQGSVGIHPILAKRYDEIRSDISAKPLIRTRVSESREPANVDDEWPRIPGYEIIERIGKGAMGSVFRALHLVSRREAAVKILSSELVARDDLVARFEREAAALRSFRHDNVVAIFDSGSVGKIHYYSMEYVIGTTLRKFVRVGALPPRVAIRFARQMTKALSAAHHRGIIHRDLKPENIIIEAEQGKALDGHERLVLVDFGLAGIVNEAVDPHPNLTQSRVSMGTVNYMAPEQHIDAKRADHRTDLFACGVILYECLTGDLPLGRFSMPREKGIAVPACVDACLIKALARSPEERYQSAEAFDQALANIEAELDNDIQESSSPLPSHTHATLSQETVFPSQWMKAPPWLERPRLIAVTLAFVVCCLVGFAIANRTPREVAISNDEVTPIFTKGSFDAPAPLIHRGKGLSSAVLGTAKNAVTSRWESESPVWGYQDQRIGYFAKQGSKGHFRRDFSFGLSTTSLTISEPFSYSARMSFDRLILPIDLTEAQHLARESLGGSPELPAGGIFLVNKKDRRAVGVIVYTDGSCGLTQVHRNGSSIQEVERHNGVCQPPLDGKSMDLKISCDPKANTCTGFSAGQKLSTETVNGLSDSNWYVALGCRNISCLFESEPKPKKKI